MSRIRLDRITKCFGHVTALADVSLDIADGEFFTVLGPPGAGKTTLLRTIVGLERPESGEVYADEEPISSVYPGDREIAIMFQNLALYPDKTVFDNLAFPLRQRKTAKDEIRRRVEQTARTLHIEHLLGRKPGKLSGGERQRVALGRTLVREPRALLLDEPLSALDALLRLEMRSELKRLQRELGRTTVYVTHDQVEAMSMSDRICVLRDGVVQQVDSPEAIYHRPVNRFVATVVGSPPMNFIPATAVHRGRALHVEHPEFALETEAGAHSVPPGECWIGVRPEDVRVSANDGGIPASVIVTEPLGGETVVDLRVGDRMIKALAPPTLELAEGQPVRVAFDPARLHVFDEAGNALLSAAGRDVFEVRATSSGG